MTGGYYGEIDARNEAMSRVLGAIENLEVEPQRLAAFIDGKPVQPSPATSATTIYRWSDLIADWAQETKAKEKTVYSWTTIIGKLTKHLGHDDAAAVSESDLIGWKNKLVTSKLSPTTIKNHITILRTLYN
jgi:hypothetical protein